MKTLILSVAAIALLRASAAYISRNPQANRYEALLHEPDQYQELVKNLASSEEFVEIAPEEPPIRISRPPQQPKQELEQQQHLTDPITTSPSHLPPASPLPQSELHRKPRFTVGTSHSQWAMVYHPYNGDGSCRTKATVHANLQTISSKGFRSVRLHNHDCNILPKLASSPLVRAGKIRLILGIHIDETGLSAAKPHVDDIIAWGSSFSSMDMDFPSSSSTNHNNNNNNLWSMVEMVVVGEEVIFNGHASAKDLGRFLSQTRAAFREAGYNGPLTTTEPIHILYESSEALCPHLDVLASNIHPFFHSDVSADTAGEFVKETMELLETVVCSDTRTTTKAPLQAVNLETGWPWRGRANGAARPGREEQRVALQGVLDRVGGRSVVLGFGDDEWMDEGEFGVEGSWGCEGMFPVKN